MSYVTYEQRGFVGVITIDKPKALNALNSEVLGDLEKVVDAIDVDATRCVIITGAGEKAFVAGADIAEMTGLTKAEGKAFGKKGNDIFRKIETLPVPVIAAVNGFALGGGCELAMSCDIRIASENAVFAPAGGFARHHRRLRRHPAAGPHDRRGQGQGAPLHHEQGEGPRGARARARQRRRTRWKILMDEAMKLAEKIARNAPIAVRATKKAINDGLQVSIDEAIAIEEELFGSCFETRGPAEMR